MNSKLISAKNAVFMGFCTVLKEKEITWILEKDTNQKLIGFCAEDDFEEKFFSVNQQGKIISVFM